MLRRGFLALLLVISTTAFSQKIQLIHSGETIDKGKILYDSGQYALALKEYFKVTERDTNYVLMLTEAALAHLGAEQYDDVLSICQKGLAKPSKYAPYFLRYQAIAEDKRGNFDRSVKMFQDAIQKYPADFGLLYNLGVTYYNNNQHEKAADIFFKVLSINPFHTGSHLNLGRISIGQGRKVHGILSFGMYLVISNTDNQRLVLLNNFLDNQVSDEGSIAVFGVNEAEKLDQIIRAKMSMDKNFKSKIPVEAAVVRQFEMFFQQLNTIGSNPEDPWIKTYLPIYQAVQKQNLVEPFIYHLISSSPNAAVKKWLSKNEKTLKAFYESMNTVIKKQREIVSLEALGYARPVQAWYNDNNSLSALGEYAAQEKRRGHWKYFHDNYLLAAEGDYNDDGKKAGIWKYFNDDGTVRSVEDYSTGEVNVYYPDGTRREHFFLKDDEIHGLVDLYYPCGPLREKLTYRMGERHGKGEKFHETGKLSMSYEYINNKGNGEFKTYYADGTPKTLENYKDDVLTGQYRSWFANKKLESEGQYTNGETVGGWTHYYRNGKIARKGNYNDAGLPIGEWEYFDERGSLTEKRLFDEEGRLHGVNSHYSDNRLHYADTYKKGILTQSVFYDLQGKEIGKYGSGDGNFTVRNYFATGQLQSEGAYRKGKNHGAWKYYNRYKKLISEYNYVDGLLQGKGTEYYPSGSKKYDLVYKDNELHGYFQEYYEHGPVKQEGWFQHGNREQQWLSYFSDGTLETDGYYLRGSLTGEYYTYAQDGKLYSVSTYEANSIRDIKNMDSKGNVLTIRKNNQSVQSYEERFGNKKLKAKFDLLCGNYVNELTKWYPDGTVYYTYAFLNGNKHGRYIFNDVTGKPAMEGTYIDDSEEGIWKSFHPNGKISKEGKYLNGLRDSVWNYYYPDGKLSSSITYRKDKSHGLSRYYSPEGVALLEKMYMDGDFISYRVINESEENVSWIDFSGSGTISVKNAEGRLVWDETYKDGMRDGHKRLYFNNGKLHEEYHYKNGDFEGPFAVYYADGKVRERGMFKNDELHGKVETFHSDGTPLKTEHYSMGTRHGKGVYYIKGTKKEYNFWDGIID